MSNSIKDVVSYLEEHPFRTESEINEDVFDYDRNHDSGSNKSYAELIRRGLRAGKINRIPVSTYNAGRVGLGYPPIKTRSQFFYFVPIRKPQDLLNRIQNCKNDNI